MKKITAFFLLLLPLFITALMFISGLIQSKNFPVSVVGISISESDQDIIWDKDTQDKPSYTFHAHVIPFNAKNQDIKWESSNKDIAEVNDEGTVKIKAYGKVMITATALGNANCVASREIDSFDTIVHDLNISNEYNLNYLAPGALAKPALETSPSIDHVGKVNSIKYELDDKTTTDIKVDENSGLITVVDGAKSGSYKLTTTITTSRLDSNEESKSVSRDTTINIGPAVDTLEWTDSNTDETISGKTTCNLFDKITFGPATKDEGKITANDFTYECDNEDVAKVDKDGKVTFNPLHQDEYALFTVTYKRNTDLKITKKIKCSNVDIKQIFFNQSYLEIPFGYTDNNIIPTNDETHPEYNLNWTTYPQLDPEQMPEFYIESTNENVVKPVTITGGKALQMVNPGKCALKVYVIDPTTKNEVYSDVCEVSVLTCDLTKEGDTPFIDNKTNFTTDSAYFFLRDCIKCARSSIDPEEIKFELNKVEGGDATIDDNNIIHFASNQTCTATLMAYVGKDTIGKQFTVTYQPGQITPIDIPSDNELKVNVGELIQLKNATPIIEGKYYEKYFDVIKDGDGKIKYFIPKQGCDISDFMIESKTDPIHLTVIEDPIYVACEQGPLYTTADTEVDFLNTINPTVFPSSATKSDGSIYEPVFEYAKGDGWNVDENIINFSKVATCEVNVKFGEINDTGVNAKYYVRSTFNDEVGKFKVTKDDALLPSYRTVMKQYDTWNSSDTLRIDNIKHSLASKITIESTTGLCNPTVTDTGLFGHIEIKANPIPGKFGQDIIKISSPTYSLFLRLEIKATITDFAVTCQQDVWGTEAVNTYVDDLSVRVTANTINKTGVTEKWSYKLNDGTLMPVTKLSDTITLSGLVEGQNILHLYNETDAEVKQYVINRKPEKDAKVTLYGSEEGIYSSCNSTSKSVMIVADGYVNSTFYDKYKTHSILENKPEGMNIEWSKTSNNAFTITGIPEETNEIVKFSLKSDAETIVKSYPIGRDQVSKIKLPGHNSLDQSDKKGMQKVHVYGNKSYYNETAVDKDGSEYPGYGTEGEVNYYKVPVVLYDKYRNIIGQKLDEQGRHEEANKARYNALKNLNITFGNSHSSCEIDTSGKFIKVMFDSHDLYTPEEIYNNAFDSKSAKNINFQVATKSNEVHADYTFVAVSGTNCWTQEPILKMQGTPHSGQGIVLQKNFGVLAQKTKENAILNFYRPDLCLYNLYGNGYCIDLKYINKQRVEHGNEAWCDTPGCFNADLAGADNETLLSRKEKIRISTNSDYPNNSYFAYSIIHNLTDGFTINTTDNSIYIKNTIFHNILNQSIYLNSFDANKKPNVYLENITLFNAGSLPLTAFGPVPFHIKGDLNVYNFCDKEMLRHIGGQVDITSLWPLVVQFARNHNMLHKDYKGDDVINSFGLTALDPETYFWDYSQNEWIKTTRGVAGSGKYLSKYADISVKIPVLGTVGADMWGSANPSVEPGAPQYYDEFDNDGRLKLSTLNDQIRKLSRVIRYF